MIILKKKPEIAEPEKVEENKEKKDTSKEEPETLEDIIKPKEKYRGRKSKSE